MHELGIAKNIRDIVEETDYRMDQVNETSRD